MIAFGAVIGMSGCSKTASEVAPRPKIIVTYSVLASIVSDLVGDAAVVELLIPDGQDPHDFQPSAKDVESINNADIVVSNGLDFEEGLLEALAAAESAGVAQFRVGNNIKQRVVEGEHVVADPHLWLSPSNFIQAMPELAAAINGATGLAIDPSAELAQLTKVDDDVAKIIGGIDSCVLVTGHNELGYFAEHYNCRVLGAIIPGLSTTSESSAKQLANVESLAKENNVKAIFTGLGTPQNITDQLASQLGVKAVSLSTHYLNGAGSYREFMINLANQIAGALR